MKKYLHIIEYSKDLRLPIKESNEHEFKYGNSIFRSSIKFAESKEQIKESFDTLYNNAKLDEKIIDLDSIVIYDNIDLSKNQELAYVYECPVCLNKTITTDKNLDFCPQCEQVKFPFDLIAILNTEQVDDLSINEDKLTTYIVVKDGKIVFKDLQKEDEV